MEVLFYGVVWVFVETQIVRGAHCDNCNASFLILIRGVRGSTNFNTSLANGGATVKERSSKIKPHCGDVAEVEMLQNMAIPHPFPYQGSKRGIARHILAHFPRDVDCLIEPFAGLVPFLLLLPRTGSQSDFGSMI